jgi:hypothetical protein
MEWQDLKSKIYYLDGSLRDIYVNNVTAADWQVWTDFVNKNFKTSFHIYDPGITTDKIDFSVVLDYWRGNRECCCMATVFIDEIIIKTYFFDSEQIENDLTPTEINSISDHEKLMNYLTELSKALDKQVILTPENDAENVLIAIDKDEVKTNIHK